MWSKVDDRLVGHRKVDELLDQDELHGLAAMGLWVLGLSKAGQQLTDGALTPRAVRSIAPELADDLAARLVEVGLWEPGETGWTIHDFLVHNPTRAKVEADREAERLRKAAWRDRKAERRRDDRPDETPPVPEGVPAGQTPDVRPESRSSRPDPTRPDPTHTSAAAAAPRAGAHEAGAEQSPGGGGTAPRPGEPETWPHAVAALRFCGFDDEAIDGDRIEIWRDLRRAATAGVAVDFGRLGQIVKADRESNACHAGRPLAALRYGLKAVADRPLGERRAKPGTARPPAPRPGRDELVIPEPTPDAHEAMARLYATVEPETAPEHLLQLQALCPLDVAEDGVLEVTATAQAGRTAPERLVPWMQQVAGQLGDLAGVRWIEREEAAERVPLVPA